MTEEMGKMRVIKKIYRILFECYNLSFENCQIFHQYPSPASRRIVFRQTQDFPPPAIRKRWQVGGVIHFLISIVAYIHLVQMIHQLSHNIGHILHPLFQLIGSKW